MPAYIVSTDCVKNLETDLQTTAEEWVAYYQDNEGMALAQMVNFFFRVSATFVPELH